MRIEGKLLLAPCKSKERNPRKIDQGGIISKFEIERINAELEILAHKRETIDGVSPRGKRNFCGKKS